MLNKDFKVGSHITIWGNRGIVEEVERRKEFKYSYEGEFCGTACWNDEQAEEVRQRGYTVEETGRTYSSFKVEFVDDLKHWGQYNHGHYGCLDEFECYGTW